MIYRLLLRSNTNKTYLVNLVRYFIASQSINSVSFISHGFTDVSNFTKLSFFGKKIRILDKNVR